MLAALLVPTYPSLSQHFALSERKFIKIQTVRAVTKLSETTDKFARAYETWKQCQ